MTLGEKLRQARKAAGLTQEQLSEKLMVSRQAITKWESDKGMPDVSNLKALAALLNVSVDYLLDDGEEMTAPMLRESYDLSAYGKGIRKTKKDRLMKEKFPDAHIITLLGSRRLTRSEHVIDNLLGFFTDAPFGIPELIHSLRNLDKEFYLVEKGDRQFFVTVTDEFIETRELQGRISDKKFTIGDWKFVRCKG